MVEVTVSNLTNAAVDAEGAVELARRVLAGEGVEDGDVGLVYVSRGHIADLKHEHLGVREETDVLAFPIDARDEVPEGVPRQLGDAVLCPQVVGDDWQAPLVHALLHLLGHDHGPKMEARERAHR